MPNLEVLYLQENEINRVWPMRGLPSLRLVNLSFNHVSDVTVLNAYLPLPNLTELYLNGNALETDPRHALYLPILEATVFQAVLSAEVFFGPHKPGT